MKNLYQIKWLLFFVILSANAQQEKGIIGSNNWLANWTEFKPSAVEYNESTEILYAKITTNTTLYKRTTYLLQGPVYVTNGATLTIEPGTLIKGDFETNGALIITKGSKLIADGKETDPIVFTSNRPQKKAGDWCGVVILGDAPINKYGGASSLAYDLEPANTMYGGANPLSDSGIFRFVRIEFAGKKIKGFKDFSSLTIAGVGSKTIIDNVMCSFANNNSFEILGGDLNLNKLVTLKSNGDDFKFSQGTQCRIDNSIAIRDSYYSTPVRSRCLNVSSYDKREEADFTKKMSNVMVTNFTMVNNSKTFPEDLAQGLVKEAVFVGANTDLSIKKSVISGFNPAIILDDEIAIETSNLAKIKLSQNYFNNCKGNIFSENSTNNEDLESHYGDPGFNNLYEFIANDQMFLNVKGPKDFDFRIKVGKFAASTSK